MVELDTGVLMVIGLNAIAWVWGAAKIMQSVTSLEKTSTKLELAVKELTGMLSEHDSRLAVIEDRMDRREPVR